MTIIEKQQQYLDLVRLRKGCDKCCDLLNPSQWKDGDYDSEQIGPWSRWQGNLNAKLMVVGQDWGTPTYFSKWKGFDNPKNNTNLNLMKLLKSIGSDIAPVLCRDQIGQLFFTNAILCLKPGNLQSEVETEWFMNCRKFLIRQIEIIRPQVVVALGERAFYSILATFDKSYKRQKYGTTVDAVGTAGGIKLFKGTRLFPVYHCGQKIINFRTRSWEEQLSDWKRIKNALR
jgi:uracil-DNA glycosylase family 4